ncbi:hypothetical protein [Priestia filamentosa]|uniref:hypothetical protein n=1 Tax=Priestia filamentosa TaxID=1402861 RepID=UPI003982C739
MKNTERMVRIQEAAQRMKQVAEDLILLTEGLGELDDKSFDAWHLAKDIQALSKPNQAHELALKLQAQGHDMDTVPRYLYKNKSSKLSEVAYC